MNIRARKLKLTIPKKNQKQLKTIVHSRMEPASKIQHAKILLMYAKAIAEINRTSVVYRWRYKKDEIVTV